MKRVYEPFDSFATEYDFMASLLSNKEFFLNNLSTHKRIALDIGCGSGILAFELAKHYERVVAIDISQDMLEIARQKRAAPNIQYLCMDANQLFFNEKFDLITSSVTFHHLQNLTTILQTIKNLLNVGGKIVLQDNVSEVETPATVGYIAGAVRDFIPDVGKYGFSDAWRLFQFRKSQPWLNHLASDRYLSEQEFREIYNYFLPNCLFHRNGCFMQVVWEYKPC